MADTSIATFAELAGIATHYDDVFGQSHTVPEPIIHKLLVAMDFDPAAATTLERLKQWHDAPLPPTRVLTAQQALSWRLPQAISAVLYDEAGETCHEITARRGRLQLPPLAMGYYRLRVNFVGHTAECRLLVAPEKAWQPETLATGERVWGIAAQLYGLHGKYSMGMGDFSDLATLARMTAPLGAQVIGLNPLHAGFPHNPVHISPYSPSSRLFLNCLYVDPRAIEGFDETTPPWSDPAFQQKLTNARQSQLVDYSLVSELKRACFEPLFARAAKTEGFDVFIRAMGEPLDRQVLFDALGEQYGPDWRAWPPEYQSPRSETSRQFAQNHVQRLDFFRWLYWQADRQLAAAQQQAISKGMAIGLYRDLAVGPDKAGAELWENPTQFISGVSVGAPPDELNPAGQNWGLPAYHPFILQTQGFAPFITLLRANMRHARALRIDHAFGLSRLFLIPDGEREGAYVHYPFAALLAVLKIESHRNRCLVIGEDLGTFPPGYKEMAAQAGIYSYRVFYFERDAHGYVPPHRYPAQALATLSTHDLPTWKAWESSADIDERSQLQLYPTLELEQRERMARPLDKQKLQHALQQQGLADRDPMVALHLYLARSPAALVMLPLEDVLGLVPAANVPGTTDQRPNWRMKSPATLPQICDTLAAMAPALNAERLKPLRDVPRATYRLQFHQGFTFYDAAKIIPYLARLGISHLYASPYFTARPGSTHGYDITDHQRLNPELGGEDGYRIFCDALAQHGLKQLLDWVPNHMGIGGSDNHWWLATLEWGNLASEAAYFDIDWTPRYPGAPVKLLLPMLGDHYGDVLDAGEISIAFEPAEGSFNACYFSHRFPICPRDYTMIASGIPAIETSVAAGQALKQQMAMDTANHALYADAAAAISHDHAALHALLERQFYRLAFWRVAASDINYRRFFDINDLAGMRVENEVLFDAMHARVLELIAEGVIHGLRIDHIDGLADPAAYLARLRERAGAGLYLTVEKIVGTGESLPADWLCDGTSGYDALNRIAALFIEPKNEARFDRIYQRFTGDRTPFATTVRHAKEMILETSLASEWRMLALSARRIAANDIYARDFPYETLKTAIRDVIADYPVYRAYATEGGISAIDSQRIAHAVAAAKQHSALADHSVYDFLARQLDGSTSEHTAEQRNFLQRFQQVSGPVMAKGLEDTSFYRYTRLLALNEVGGDPAHFGVRIGTFHQQQMTTLRHGMIATATHDTKRGEDARMRLAALSEMPREWLGTLLYFKRHANAARASVKNEIIPDTAALDYFICQTLLASWPLHCLKPGADSDFDAYRARLKEYFTKALREAKLHTNWNHPDEAYEANIHHFLDRLLAEPFLSGFLPYLQHVAKAGAYNSLAQLALKMTLPGVPDIYQGCEYWDFSLVDPDNRRPVDFRAREASLPDETPLPALLSDWTSGVVKQHLLKRLLKIRAAYPLLFRDGDYQPIKVKGKLRHHVLAFSRVGGGQEIIVVVPIRVAGHQADWPLGHEFWSDTVMERDITGWQNLLTNEKIVDPSLGAILNQFPLTLLINVLIKP